MVRRVIGFVYKEVRGLHQAAYILAAFTFGSQVLALVRDRLLAAEFGADSTLDIYYSAFRVPDLLFVLFASTLSIYVLIPFVTAKQSRSTTEAKDFLSSVFTVFLLGYTTVALIAFLFMPLLMEWFFPGIADKALLTTLTRILLLQPLLLGVSNLLGVVTQVGHRFVLYAISPLLYNLGIIIGIVLLYPIFGMYGLMYGVIFGASLHMLIQWPLVYKSKLNFSLTKHICFADVRTVLKSSFPRAIALSLNQIVLLVLISMAGLMTAGSVSVFQFAFNLQSVPLAIVGMSYSVAAFPTLAYLFSNKDWDKFRIHIATALRHIIFWSVPILVLCIVLRAQLVRVILGSGRFDWSDTRLTAAVFAIFVVSLAAQAVNLLLVRVFYAGNNTATPLKIGIITSTFTVAAAYFGVWCANHYPTLEGMIATFLRVTDISGTEVLFLAVAYTMGLILQSLLLLVALRIKFSVSLRTLFKDGWQALYAAFLGGVSAYAALQFFVSGLNTETFLGIFLQGFLAGMFGLVGVVLGYLSVKSKTLKEVADALEKRLFKTDVVGEEHSI
ncbi:hypothetical protein CL653_01855 [bacterium]|nr:hypothetical protein [bacterium]